MGREVEDGHEHVERVPREHGDREAVLLEPLPESGVRCQCSWSAQRSGSVSQSSSSGVCAERSSSPYAATSSLLSHMFPERGEEMTATRKAR